MEKLKNRSIYLTAMKLVPVELLLDPGQIPYLHHTCLPPGIKSKHSHTQLLLVMASDYRDLYKQYPRMPC